MGKRLGFDNGDVVDADGTPPGILVVAQASGDQLEDIKRRVRDAMSDPSDVEIHDADCGCEKCTAWRDADGA